MKPVLIGMNNPLSERPEYALWPDPPGCTGHRIWQMLNARTGASTHDYIRSFDRRNLVIGQWDRTRAREEARRLMASGELCGRVAVLLGEKVREAFGLDKYLIHPLAVGDTMFRQLPHPSGLNRWYNEPVNVTMAGMLLADLYEEALKCAA